MQSKLRPKILLLGYSPNKEVKKKLKSSFGYIHFDFLELELTTIQASGKKVIKKYSKRVISGLDFMWRKANKNFKRSSLFQQLPVFWLMSK